MANNKIGIEVQVEFPTVAELQKQLDTKWQKVKNSFSGKINIDIDKNSMKVAKSTIKKSLSEELFKIKLDVDITKVTANINKVNKQMKELDTKINKKREVKIDFKISDLDKSFKEILNGANKLNKATKDGTKEQRDTNDELDRTIDKFTKMKVLKKQLADGSYAKTTVVTQEKGAGVTKTETTRPNGLVDEEVTRNRKQALQEIEQQYRKINELKVQSINKSGKELADIKERIDKEDKYVRTLRNGYLEEYKTQALSEKSIQKIVEKGKELEKTKKIALEEKQIQGQISNAIKEVVASEKQKQAISMKILQTTGEEQKGLIEQYNQHSKNQKELEEKHKISEKMTAEQKRSLEIIKETGALQRNTLEQKRIEGEIEQQLIGSLKTIHSLREKIASIESRSSGKSIGELSTLSALKQQLALEEKSHGNYKKHLDYTNQVTDELQKQYNVQEKIHLSELDRIESINKTQNALREYMDVTNKISQLNRDLVYAGMREQAVIEKQIDSLNQKRDSVKRNLEQQNALTDAVQEEVKAIERAQQEQRQLNRARQDAREKDISYNDTGGLVDPYSFYQNARQGAMAMFQPVYELDTALMDVKKVADESNESLQRFAEGAYDAGSSLGVSATDYMKAVEKWITAGHTLAQSEDYAQKSLIGSFVGNIKPEDMVKYMSVPLNAYKDAELESADVINSMNEVANNNAIEMDNLGKAYVRSAGIAHDTGASFAELTAMITTAEEATRKGGERIGTGIKTIGMNLSNINAQMTDGEKRKFNFFESIGVDFRDDKGEMLGYTDILENLSNVYDGLSTEDKGTAMFYMAGKEHAETLTAIIKNWDRMDKVVTEVNTELGKGEMGSAYEEHERQSESLRFKVAKLTNAWDEMMNSASGGSGAIGSVIDGLVFGLEQLNRLASNEKFMEAMKYLFGGIAIHAGFNLMRRFFDTIGTGFGGILNNAKELKRLLKEIKGVKVDDALSSTVLATGGGNGKGKNNTSGGNTTVVSGGRGNKKNKNKNNNSSNVKAVGDELNVVSGKGKALWGVLKGVVGFIPILGDALILLELAGVPVFDSLVGGVKKLLGEEQKAIDKTKEHREEFEKTNKIINGDVEKGEASGTGFRKTFDKSVDERGYMSSGEYEKFQEEFNNKAKDLGIDVKITMNDNKHIMEALELFDEKLKNVKANSAFEIVTDTSGAIEGIQKTEDKMESLKVKQKAYKESLIEAEETLAYFEEQRADGKFVDGEMYSQAISEVDRFKEKLKETNTEMKEQEELQEKYGENINKNIETLLGLGSAIDVSANGFKENSIVVQEMTTQFGGMESKVKNAKRAFEILNGEADLTAEDFENLKELAPDLADAMNSTNYSELNDNLGGVKDELKNVFKGYVENGDEALISGQKAIEAVALQMMANGQLTGSFDQVVKALQDAGLNTIELKKKFDLLPHEKKIEMLTPMSGASKANLDLMFKANQMKDKTVTLTTSVVRKNYVQDIKMGSPGNPMLNKSVSSNSISSNGGITSNSVSSNGTMQEGVAKSISNATSSNYNNDYNEVDKNARVSSDVWRHWSKEMSLDKLDESMDALNRSIDRNSENHSQLIKLYEQQKVLMKKQISGNNSLYNSKDSEMNSVLNSLKKYGFKVNTSSNTISNLGQSKNLKGEKATEAEELLNTWKSLTSEMAGIKGTIADLNNEIANTTEEIKNIKIEQEMLKLEGVIKKATTLLDKVENSNSISDTRISSVGTGDKELQLIENERAMNGSKGNLTSLINQFNEISKKSIANPENAEELQGTLESLGDEILSQSDSIIEYQKTINDLEFGRVIDDLASFDDAIDSNTDKMSNNIENLKEGLVSGTKLSDLQSYNSTDLNLNRDNAYEKSAKQRIDLETEVQNSLIAFAKKNVDRAKKVANAELDISVSKYNELTKIQKDYTAGKKVSASKIKTDFDELVSIGNADEDYKFVSDIDNAYDKVLYNQDNLNEKYLKDMSKKDITQAEKDTLTNKYVIDGLKLQEDYYKASIEGSKKAISELNKQLKDSTLDDETEANIKEQIKTIEESIVDSQNSIKDSIEERFNFEFGLLEEAIGEYDKFSNEVQYGLDLLEYMGGSNLSTSGVLLQEMADIENARNSKLKETLSSLESQLSLYEEGSYEWGLINTQVEEYNSQLQESNKEILEMNKNILNNSFGQAKESVEKKLFNGKTLSQYKEYQELFIDGLEREIALESAFKRIKDLGDESYLQKLSLLDKQEKLSSFEMDYLNKQLDVLELQKKLENLKGERTIQTLKKQMDGTWDWEYVADATELATVEEELNNAKLELSDLEKQAREDYLSKLEGVLTNAESGVYGSIEEFKEAINNLGEAYEVIIGDMPQIQDEYIKSMVDAYSKYISDNGAIIDKVDLGNASSIYNGFGEEVVKAFDKIGDSMAEAFANKLITTFPVLVGKTPNEKQMSTDKSVSIVVESVEFPNIKKADGIEEAILSLPQIANQKSKGK